MNSIAGLLTTMINVYTAQKGVWSVTAKITASVTGSLIAMTLNHYTDPGRDQIGGRRVRNPIACSAKGGRSVASYK